MNLIFNEYEAGSIKSDLYEQSNRAQAPSPWEEYERLKRELPEDLTAHEYQQACQHIADLLGV